MEKQLKDQQRKFLLRQSNRFRLNEIQRKKIKNKGSFKVLIEQFHKSVQKGPEYICTCCDKLWYRESVKKIKKENKFDKTLAERCITGVLSGDGIEWICNTCLQNMKAKNFHHVQKQMEIFFQKNLLCWS